MSFGDFIKAKREEKGLKMREVERKTGISQAYLSQIESGKRSTPKPDIIKKLAEGLVEDYSYLMYKAGYLDVKFEGDTNLTEAEIEKRIKFLTESHIEKLELLNKNDEVTITSSINLPINIEYQDVNGEMMVRSTKNDDVFNIYYLLQMDVELYYKDKPLNVQEKKKIIKMLNALLE